MPDRFPPHLLLATLAAWVIGLLKENRVLRALLGGPRLRLTDDQRRRLAVRGKRLGRRLLARFATIVTPDTLLRWHHRLIAAKWTRLGKRVGRPGLMKRLRSLIVRMATDNPKHALREFVAHYHTERPHQGLGNGLIHGVPSGGEGDVVVRERLGGLLNSYRRAAA